MSRSAKNRYILLSLAYLRPQLLCNVNRTSNGSEGWKTLLNAGAVVGAIRET